MLLTLALAYHCLWPLGLRVGEPATARVGAHSLLGCAVYGALVVKVFADRSRSAP